MLQEVNQITMSKKKKIKLSRAQKKQLYKFGVLSGVGITGLMLGIVTTVFLYHSNRPRNLVWASEPSVKVPKDLRKFLEARNDCEHYRGTNSPTGVGLWGVYQTTQSKFAKIAYGCSWSLSSYIMAIKQAQGWILIQPTEYFAPFKDAVDPSKGALPYCAAVEKYKIPGDIEPFCVQADGNAKANDI